MLNCLPAMRAAALQGLTVAALALTLAAAPAVADDLSATDSTAIRQVIQDQLAAFRRDDAPGAYAFAAPGIQTIFPTPDIFMNMVRQGYPPVYRPAEVEFRTLTRTGDRITQDVYMVGPDGRGVIARYSMERQPDGHWKISGCTLTTAPDLSA
jgi:hypothetical protein